MGLEEMGMDRDRFNIQPCIVLYYTVTSTSNINKNQRNDQQSTDCVTGHMLHID